MKKKIKAGNLVQIYHVLLHSGRRASQVPDDTKKVPLELKVKGFLLADALLGDEVEILTVTRRKLKGTLIDSNPSYEHKFGKVIPELLQIGPEVRKILMNKEG